MEREKQLEFCKRCVNRKMDMQQGLICKLTDEKADFTEECPDFLIDEKIKDEEQKQFESIRPNKKRAEIAQLLILLVMVVDIVSIFSSYLQYDLLLSFQNNEVATEEVINSNDLREQIVAIIYLVVYVVSIITFIQWFRRAYYNLNLRVKCNHSEIWAVGGWFVPIWSLFRPYQIMKEMWVESSKILKFKANHAVKESTLIIGVWWVLWLISNYLGNYAMKSTFKANTIEELINSTMVDMILSILGIPLAILTVMIIESYSNKEEKLAELNL